MRASDDGLVMADFEELRAWGMCDDHVAGLRRVDAARTSAEGDPKLAPGRVVSASRGHYRVVSTENASASGPAASVEATLSGSIAHRSTGPLSGPAVGDWVVVSGSGDQRQIVDVLPRTSLFVRRAAGRDALPQIVAANVDVVFIVCAVGASFNEHRIERYLALVTAGGSEPVVVLNKADREEAARDVRRLEACTGARYRTLTLSALTGQGLEKLAAALHPTKTHAFVGSSGVGKSTLINRLLGDDAIATSEVREGDDKGRHTTTRREILQLPGGALVMDTPGMREIGLWDAESGVDDVFADVASLAAECRFRDCSHSGEPGCAVDAAVGAGTLSADRVASYDRLRRELAHESQRSDAREARKTKRDWKQLSKDARRRRVTHAKLGFKSD